MANYNRSSLILSVNRALWGKVTANLRQVTATVAHGALYVQAVFDAEPSKADTRIVDEVGAKAVSDFPELKLIVEALGKASAEPLEVGQGWSQVFRRQEDRLS